MREHTTDAPEVVEASQVDAGRALVGPLLQGLDRLRPTDAAWLQRAVGNRNLARLAATGTGLPRQVLARLGKPLDEPLGEEDPAPAHGEDEGKQRRYSREQFESMWEAEQGRKITRAEQVTIMKGCVGITENNIGTQGVAHKLDEVYATLEQAQAAVDAYNADLPSYDSHPYQVFAMHFWSNQDPVRENRMNPDPTAFLPDESGRVDMSDYRGESRPDHTNFDFGWWDEASRSYWHANHADPNHPDVKRLKLKIKGPMEVYQSTREVYSNVFEEEPGEARYGYPDFDREVFGVVRSQNYDPSRGMHPSLRSPRFLMDDGAPEPTIQRVFEGKSKLGSGSPRGAVSIIQQMLVERNYDLGSYGPNQDGVDGRYGTRTSDAVKQFKSDENLPAPEQGTVERPMILALDDLFGPVTAG